MLRKTLARLLVAGLTCAGGIVLVAQTASAMPVVHYDPMAKTSGSNILPAAWVYVQTRHGHRYRARRAGYGYYYGGYWYARPWWTIGIGPVIVYNPALYGPRYRYRRPGYGYYHHGYWYRRHWW